MFGYSYKYVCNENFILKLNFTKGKFGLLLHIQFPNLSLIKFKFINFNSNMHLSATIDILS